MKVLFVEDVLGTAYAGDVRDVKDGFARNYLLPKKLAVLATSDQMGRVERLRTAASKRRDATETEMTALAATLEGATITMEARAGRNDRLYGSITNAMVAEEISKVAGREIDRRRIGLQPVRQLGKYEIPVKLFPGIEPTVTLIVAAVGQTVEEEELLEEALGEPEAPEAEADAVEAAEEAETLAPTEEDEPAAVPDEDEQQEPDAK
jgi:large subunit ribosomal protein L9